jgi:hypothetical protein
MDTNKPVELKDLATLANKARKSQDEYSLSLVKTAIEAIARSEAAATEARILAGFINDM